MHANYVHQKTIFEVVELDPAAADTIIQFDIPEELQVIASNDINDDHYNLFIRKLEASPDLQNAQFVRYLNNNSPSPQRFFSNSPSINLNDLPDVQLSGRPIDDDLDNVSAGLDEIYAQDATFGNLIEELQIDRLEDVMQNVDELGVESELDSVNLEDDLYSVGYNTDQEVDETKATASGETAFVLQLRNRTGSDDSDDDPDIIVEDVFDLYEPDLESGDDELSALHVIDPDDNESFDYKHPSLNAPGLTRQEKVSLVLYDMSLTDGITR